MTRPNKGAVDEQARKSLVDSFNSLSLGEIDCVVRVRLRCDKMLNRAKPGSVAVGKLYCQALRELYADRSRQPTDLEAQPFP